jgi:hypothetical protein
MPREHEAARIRGVTRYVQKVIILDCAKFVLLVYTLIFFLIYDQEEPPISLGAKGGSFVPTGNINFTPLGLGVLSLSPSLYSGAFVIFFPAWSGVLWIVAHSSTFVPRLELTWVYHIGYSTLLPLIWIREQLTRDSR